MRTIGSRLAIAILPTVAGLTLLSPRPGSAQSAFVAGGVGPTAVIEGGSGNRNWFGMAGYPGRRGIRFRLAGAETVSRLWLSADLTLQPATPRVVRLYGLVGAGLAIDFNETDPVITVGGGLRVQWHRLIFLFGEARLQTIPGSSLGNPGTIMPLTFGVGLGT
jgi:hypothetical protein